jgi:hypothetical protein
MISNTAWEREEVALASVLSVLRRLFPSSSKPYSTTRDRERERETEIRQCV